MNPHSNRDPRTPRQASPSMRMHYVKPERSTPVALWWVLGIIAAAAAGLIIWRLQVQQQQQQTDAKVVALLESADRLILENREDDAAAATNQALELLPGDRRSVALMERIEAKRKLIHEKLSTTSNMALAQAEQYALTNLETARRELDRLRSDTSLTPEAQKAAADRMKALKGPVCSLRVPKEWLPDSVLTIDGVTKEPENSMVTGLMPGKRDIVITRFGFREISFKELDFNGTEPVVLPAFEWVPRGTKVSVTSSPAGAAVWYLGKDTGKVTPCTIPDVEDGPVEFLLKRAGYENATVSGEVKERRPLKLSIKLEPN
jgi:hypothetical protein